jgi:hypothetical protein
MTEGGAPVEKASYNAASLERVLLVLERHYGMSSAEFYAAHEAGESLEGIPEFDRHVWASFYRDVRRLRREEFAGDAEHLLALA